MPVAVQAERTAIKIKKRNDLAESRMVGPDDIQFDKLASLSASFLTPSIYRKFHHGFHCISELRLG